MSALLITGLVLMALGLVGSIYAFVGAANNLKNMVGGKQGFDEGFSNHIGSMKKMALLGLPWVGGIGCTVIAVVRDYVLPAIGN